MLYNAMLVSAVQQSELAACVHISPPSWASPCSSLTPLGYHRPSWAPCAVQQLPTTVLSYMYFPCKVVRALTCRQLTLLMRENSGLCRLGGPGYGYLALFTFFLTFIQLAVVQPTTVNISANGFGYAICQVCNNVYFLFC